MNRVAPQQPSRPAFLSRAICADIELAERATAHSRWQLAFLAASLLLAVPLNAAGFTALLIEATGWPSSVWTTTVQIVTADILAAIIFILDARGVSAAIYRQGWVLAHERRLFGRAATAPPPAATLPAATRISFSLIMAITATGGLLLGALHTDTDAARRQGFWAANIEAQKAATMLVEQHLADARTRKADAMRDFAQLRDDGRQVDGAHPVVLEIAELRKALAEQGKALANLQDKQKRAENVRNCEDQGGNFPGCTGNKGRWHAYNAADAEANGASAEIAILKPRFDQTKQKLAAAEEQQRSLRDAATLRLTQARDDERVWEGRSYGDEYRKLVEAQGSFKPRGTSLITQVAAFIALAKSEPTATSIVGIILALATLGLDLVNVFGARSWVVPHDYAVALVLRTERAMHRVGDQFQADHHQLLRSRDVREYEAVEFGKRERQRLFDEENAEAATRAALQAVRDDWRAHTTH